MRLGNPPSILDWKIPGTKESCGLQFMGVTESDTAERLNTRKVNELAIILASLDFEHQKVGAPICTI